MGMGTNNNNNNSTPSTTTTTTSLERSYFEAFYSKTTPSTTTQSKWAAAATPTAPARAAPALRAPAPSSSQHGNHVNGLSARVTRHHGLQEWIEGQIDEDTRLKMEGKETSVTEMHF